jgi:adenylate kinase family enzyme
MKKKILIMGLPGAGKTTLAKRLAPRLNAVDLNADDVGMRAAWAGYAIRWSRWDALRLPISSARRLQRARPS